MSDKSMQAHTIIETAINALIGIGASHQTALSLLATGAIFKMKDLDQLRQIRQDVNSSIICCDDSIDEDTRVVIGPCDCILPESNSLIHRRDME